jgi:transposase
MLKTGILNPRVNELLCRVRHTNTLVIADRGFPFWPQIETVDLALVDDVPTVLQVLNAILYVAEHGCRWRGLPKRFGNWHTIYTRMSRWAKSGVLDRAFEQLQQAQVVQIKIEAVSLDSTSVKVHPDGTGAAKKTVRRLSASPVAGGTPRSTSSQRTRARP